MTAGSPPQQDNMDAIRDSSLGEEDEEIWEIEYFIRSFAALGSCESYVRIVLPIPACSLVTTSDFGFTSGIFRNTASQVQELLSEITPDMVVDPTQSLPAMFYQWLSDTLQDYPDGCT